MSNKLTIWIQERYKTFKNTHNYY